MPSVALNMKVHHSLVLGINFTSLETTVTFPEWPAKKSTYPFSAVPVLEVAGKGVPDLEFVNHK